MGKGALFIVAACGLCVSVPAHARQGPEQPAERSQEDCTEKKDEAAPAHRHPKPTTAKRKQGRRYILM